MPSIAKTFLGVALLSALACGGSSADPAICDKLAAAVSGARGKAAPCAASYTPPALGLSVETCRSTISRCSDSDAQHIRDVIACLDALPTCAAPATWGPAYDACAAKVGPLAGQGC
jgi:hypothetical protein